MCETGAQHQRDDIVRVLCVQYSRQMSRMGPMLHKTRYLTPYRVSILPLDEEGFSDSQYQKYQEMYCAWIPKIPHRIMTRKRSLASRCSLMVIDPSEACFTSAVSFFET